MLKLSRNAASCFCACSLVLLTPSQQVRAEDAMVAAPAVQLLLSNLPNKTKRAYHALLAAAGEPKAREILPMTKAETWVVPSDKIAALKVLAVKSGVTVTEVVSPEMNALMPLPQGQPMSPKQSAMMKSAMKEKSTMGVAMMGLPEPTMLEYALTRGMNSPETTNANLTLKLSDTVTVTARRTDLVEDGDNYVWQGEIEGTGEPVTLVVWPEGRMAGTILHGGHIFKVQSMGGGMHGIIESEPAMMPPEHAPMSGDMMKKMNMTDDPLVKEGDASMLMPKMPAKGEKLQNLQDAAPTLKTDVPKPALTTPTSPSYDPHSDDSPVTITLIVAYTKAAARHYLDIEKDLITLAIAEANQSFRNSGIKNVTLKAVHMYQTDYVEKGTHFEHMYQFADNGDGKIYDLRKKYHANVAVMIVDDGNGCGLSAGVAPPASRAFAVVHHGCAATTYSLAHEIGHIIGARHDSGLDDGTTPFAFGHGFVNGTKWRTMMSYEQSCGGCPRLPIWSSPDVAVRGEIAGSELANNARVIREGARRVAGFK